MINNKTLELIAVVVGLVLTTSAVAALWFYIVNKLKGLKGDKTARLMRKQEKLAKREQVAQEKEAAKRKARVELLAKLKAELGEVDKTTEFASNAKHVKEAYKL